MIQLDGEMLNFISSRSKRYTEAFSDKRCCKNAQNNFILVLPSNATLALMDTSISKIDYPAKLITVKLLLKYLSICE